jgi:hypothetical protein
LGKKLLGYILGDFFSQTHPVTLFPTSTFQQPLVMGKNSLSGSCGDRIVACVQGDQIGRILAHWANFNPFGEF